VKFSPTPPAATQPRKSPSPACITPVPSSRSCGSCCVAFAA